MGEHRGWIIVDLWDGQPSHRQTGKRYLARVRDPWRGNYRNKRCASRAAARDWIKRTQTEMDPAAVRRDRSTAVSDLRTAYVAGMRRRGRSDKYVRETDDILTHAEAAGLRDLADPHLSLLAERWVDEATCWHPNRRGRPLSNGSRNKLIRTLRAFGRWAYDRDLVDRIPFRSLGMVTTTDYMRSTFTLDECRGLVEAARWAADDYGTAVALCLYTGARATEPAALEWPHVRWRERMLTLYGKRRKERAVPIQAELADGLRTMRRDTGPVFDLPRLTEHDWHRRQFAAYLRACGIEQDTGRGRRTPHSLRHTWVSMMLASGENAPLVQVYAGHTALATTAGYARSQVLYRDAAGDWGRGVLRLRGCGEIAQAPVVVAAARQIESPSHGNGRADVGGAVD